MNRSFIKQLEKLEQYNSTLSEALPALRIAGTTLTGADLRREVDRIGNEYGLAELA